MQLLQQTKWAAATPETERCQINVPRVVTRPWYSKFGQKSGGACDVAQGAPGSQAIYSIARVGCELAADLAACEVGRMHVCVHRARTNRTLRPSQIPDHQPLVRRTDDVRGDDLTCDRP